MRCPGRAALRRAPQAQLAVAAGVAMLVVVGPGLGAADDGQPLTIRVGVSTDIFFDVGPKDAGVWALFRDHRALRGGLRRG